MNLFRIFYIIQFVYATTNVKNRFKDLNKTLKSFKYKICKIEDSGTFLLAEIFHNLCDAIAIINQTFTFHFIGIVFDVMVNLFINSFSKYKTFKFQITLIFALYSTFRLIKKPTKDFEAEIFLSAFGIVSYIFLVISIIFFGDSTTKEAEKSAEMLGKLMNTKKFCDGEKLDLMFLMSQIQSRKVDIQNMFFTINWNVLLTVSKMINL